LRGLDYVAVRSHSETLRILRKLELQDQVRLSAAHFMAVPSIVHQTDLAVIMPAEIAETFEAQGGYVVLQADLPESAFDVSALELALCAGARKPMAAGAGQRSVPAAQIECPAHQKPPRLFSRWTFRGAACGLGTSSSHEKSARLSGSGALQDCDGSDSY
jgi:hypothetical protein